MLHLVIGRAGTGKTTQMRNMLSQKALADEQGLILLVPEQYSFESERALLRLTGPENAGKVQVLSFTRLADQVFKIYGGIAGERIDDGARIAVMDEALEQIADQLTVYRRFAHSAEFALAALHAVQECKQAAITSEQLRIACAKVGEQTLGKKSEELALIMAAYEALVAQSYVDSQDDLTRLAQMLDIHRYFAGRTVVLDSFKGFTGQQMAVMERIIAQSAEVYVTLCTDMLQDQDEGMGVFSGVKDTARQIIAIAQRHHITVASPQVLNETHRYHNREIKLLEQAWADPESETYADPTEHIQVYCAQTAYEEADWVAACMKRLVREEGYRYRDIAVIARNAEDYRGIIDTALEKYRIPFFMDRRRSVNHQPLMQFVCSAMAVVLHHFRSEDIFACLKTGLLGLDIQEISLVENYTFVWGITGKIWHKEWKSNPDGVSDTFTDQAKEQLVKINALRERIVQPLDRFARRFLHAETAQEMSAAIYWLLEDCGVAGRLRAFADAWEKQGQPEEADLQRQTWDLLMQILDQMAKVMAHSNAVPERFAKLFEMVLSAQDLGSIPQGVDEVSVGSADRMRPAQPKVVFLIGANEGVFPALPSAGGLFTEAERRQMEQLGLPLPDRSEKDMIEEKFLCYSSLCTSSDKVFVSYYRRSASGEESTESELVREVLRIFPLARRRPEKGWQEDLCTVEALTPALELYARMAKDVSPLKSSLEEVLEQESETAAKVKMIRKAVLHEPAALHPSRARELFAHTLHVSPTGVEVFHKCRFSYFCKYGMRARALRAAALDVNEKGTLVHYALEMLINEYGSKGLIDVPQEQMAEKIHELIDRYVVTAMGGWEDKSSRFRYLIHRVEVLLRSLVAHLAEELAQTEFVTAACEVMVGMEDGGIPPMELPLEDGLIRVHCVVDRVDTFRKDGTTYFRVIDYKTGTRTLRLEDILQGLSLQMFLYLYAIARGTEQMSGEHMVPAGVLYMPAKRPSVREDHTEDAQEDLKKALKMKGLLLHDDTVLRAMEPDGKGTYVPVVYTQKGNVHMGWSSVASLAFFGQMSKVIDKLLIEMGNTLHQGDIAADPLDSKPGSACLYCEYQAVCPLDRTQEHRRVPVLSDQQKKDILEGGDPYAGEHESDA